MRGGRGGGRRCDVRTLQFVVAGSVVTGITGYSTDGCTVTLRTRGNRKYFNVLNKVSKSTVLNVLNYLRVE